MEDPQEIIAALQYAASHNIELIVNISLNPLLWNFIPKFYKRAFGLDAIKYGVSWIGIDLIAIVTAPYIPPVIPSEFVGYSTSDQFVSPATISDEELISNATEYSPLLEVYCFNTFMSEFKRKLNEKDLFYRYSPREFMCVFYFRTKEDKEKADNILKTFYEIIIK